MRIVIDTNVLVSAFLTPGGKPSTILKLALRGDFEICVSTAILAEYEQVLTRPKFAGKIHSQNIKRFIEIMDSLGLNIVSKPSNMILPDEADRKFYDTAVAADAILITGNKKHYPHEPFILDPAEFLDLVIRN